MENHVKASQILREFDSEKHRKKLELNANGTQLKGGLFKI